MDKDAKTRVVSNGMTRMRTSGALLLIGANQRIVLWRAFVDSEHIAPKRHRIKIDMSTN